MLKHVVTLFRGRSYEAAEAFVDQNALTILRQQIREAGATVKTSRRAVAIAIANQEREENHCKALIAQAKDLETRAIAALESNKEDLAQQAAEAIALLEDEIATSKNALDQYRTEIASFKTQILEAQTQLRALKRGEQLANVANHTERLHAQNPASMNNSLQDAKATLNRLQRNQQQANSVRKTERAMAQTNEPADIAERMAAQGLGEPLKSSASSVLDRLKAKQAKTNTSKN